MSNTVTLNVTLSGSLQQNDMMAGGNNLGGSTGAISRTALDYAPFELPDNDPTFTNENKTNIFSWLNDYVDLANNKSFKGSIDLGWQPYSFLRYNLRTGGNININERKRWYGMELYQGMNNQGYLSESNLSRNNYSVENMFSFNTKLGEIGTMDATAGVTYEEYYNTKRHHESLDNLTPEDVYLGRGEQILKHRQKINQRTMKQRRISYQTQKLLEQIH